MMLHNRWGHGEVSCYASSVCDTGSSVLDLQMHSEVQVAIYGLQV